MTADSPATFGERIRSFRHQRGMSQKVLAATVGRSHAMLSAIENGMRQIHVDELVTFAEALNVKPAALIGGDDADRFAEGFDAGRTATIDRLRAVLSALEAER